MRSLYRSDFGFHQWCEARYEFRQNSAFHCASSKSGFTSLIPLLTNKRRSGRGSDSGLHQSEDQNHSRLCVNGSVKVIESPSAFYSFFPVCCSFFAVESASHDPSYLLSYQTKDTTDTLSIPMYYILEQRRIASTSWLTAFQFPLFSSHSSPLIPQKSYQD